MTELRRARTEVAANFSSRFCNFVEGFGMSEFFKRGSL